MFVFLRLFVSLLTVSYLFSFFLGCGTDEASEEIAETDVSGGGEIAAEPPPVILYPGAPVISVEITAFNGFEGRNDPALHYRLKAEEPLPYDIEVRLSVQRTYTVEGWLYGDVDASKELEADKVIKMRKDRRTYEDSMEGGSDARIQTRALQILPWKGPGDDPYNVGRPSRLKIERKPVEGKVPPRIISVVPAPGSILAKNDILTITFDQPPSDAEIIHHKLRNLTIKIEDNRLIAIGFPPGGQFKLTPLQIRWGGGKTVHLLTYRLSTALDNLITVNGRDVVILQGALRQDRTLIADFEYILRGAVFVKDGATLTIQPGVKIYGEQASNGTLIITQGSKIMAEGTPNTPIVMSSDAREGSRARGQWGGLIINGRAPTNRGVTFGEGDTGAFGGNNPADSSGVLRYVVVEYAGIEFSPDNELNGIAFQGVGSGTVVDHVQVHMSQDDGVEIFGGTVNLKYVIVTGARDDSFDWTDGWRGKGQFWVAQHYGDDADNGFEVDNNSRNNEALPRSAATLYNATLVGDPAGPESDNGMLIREGAAGTFANFIVTGFNKVGLDINDKSTHRLANDGELVVENSIFFENNIANFGDERDDDGFDEARWAKGLNNHEKNPNLTDPFNKRLPNFRPRAGAALVPAARPPADGFFEPVNFIGGVSPVNDWTRGWTTHLRN